MLPKQIMLRSWLFLLVTLAVLPAAAQDGYLSPGEYEVKAAFVYKIATFVDWQDALFDSDDAPLVFGILGDDPFGATFDSVIANKYVGSHPLQVVRAKQFSKLPYCHVLFLCASDADKTAGIVRELISYRTLTVCDVNPADARGFMVYLMMSEDRVRLAINHKRTAEAGIKISSRVLKLADEITEETKP